jgi:iron(III) transport system substrate-binding protein
MRYNLPDLNSVQQRLPAFPHRHRKESSVSSLITSRPRALALTLTVGLLALLAVAASGASGAGAAGPASKAKWAEIVAAAKKEGSVTIYSPQAPTNLQAMAAKFKEKYGINVTINRNIDSVLLSQINAEIGSGKVQADLWVQASKNYVLGALGNGWAVDAVGPDLYTKAYDRSQLAKPGKSFIVGTAILAMAWNTQLYPKGLKDIPDLLDPALKGKIGIPQPTAASFVDWYLWLEETYGKNFLQRLAAQQPKIYLSSLPIMQAVASGEIAASPFVPGNALDLKKQGAPIEFKLANKGNNWNAPFWGIILKQAPHPNAAQVLADFLVTKEGQETSQHLSGTVIKGVPDAFYAPPRIQKLSNLTPKKIADFQARWNSLFKK